MKAVELYAGAGGLALGASLVGFKPLAVVECVGADRKLTHF